VEVPKILASLPTRGILRSLLKRSVIPYAIAAVVVLAGITGVAAETGTFSSATPTPTPAVATASSAGDSLLAGFPAAGGGANIVQVKNHTDGRFRMGGNVKVNQIPGPNAGPKNEAFAYSSCTDCQTMAVALEINLISTSARNIQPLNLAVAVNYRCTRCVTYARAIQYDIQVADPNQVRSDVRELVRQMDATLNHIKTSDDTFAQALAEVNTVIGQFDQLGMYLTDRQDMATDPTTPGATVMPSEDASPAASPTTTVSGAPTASSSPSPEATPSNSP
jgi:putative peptide zinc metalloprotease protein